MGINDHMTLNQAIETSKLAHSQGKKVVLVTGVFDLLHQEHINFLYKACEIGDLLLVGVETDERVRQMKGEGRPIQILSDRILGIEQLGITQAVFDLPAQFSLPADHELLISQLRPDILAVSSHTLHQDKKQLLMERYGGRLQVVHQHNPEVSTSEITKSRKIHD